MVKGAGGGHGFGADVAAALGADGGEQADQGQADGYRQRHSRDEHPKEKLVVELQVHIEQDDDGELDAGQQEQQDGGGRLAKGVGDHLFPRAGEVHDDYEFDDGNGE